MSKLTHIDKRGKAQMVDIGDKPDRKRKAVARGTISLSANTVKLINENNIKKGDVLTVAKIAGIQAAKQTANLIPLCHTLILNKVDVETRLIEGGVEATATVTCEGKTGVEMEAITAVSIALITVYDMCKAVDKNMEIGNICLVEKEKV